ncbi:Hypothetical protein, putative [Bodo saltans]|uniref:Uncharacterized protein n=1 Tax=Bodo saltans TaxID=75058 RepID=A0A0S4JTK8_BODSA|nr:Hypothetical protein, putative [Bodo saltans]|eukprot:CUG93548.1 Hypothetical protein, putative [Bodo saltans]
MVMSDASTCILDDPSSQRRYALASDAFTVIEGLWEAEEELWHTSVVAFQQRRVELLSTTRVTALDFMEEEAVCRLAIVKNSLREFHELCLITELAKHGCDEGTKWHAAGTCALPLIHELPPQPIDEPWRRMPQMVEVDSSPLQPEKYTAHNMALKLAGVLGKEASPSAVNRVVLPVDEVSQRLQLSKDEETLRRRLHREHVMLRSGLEDIERTVVEEFRAIQLARLPVDERAAFLQAPTLHHEKFDRSLVHMEEDALRVVLLLECSAIAHADGLRLECRHSAEDLIARRRQEQQDAMMWTRLRTQGKSRFQSWQRWLQRTKNVVRRRMEAPQRQSFVHRALLMTYCRKWFSATVAVLQQRRMLELQTVALLEAHVIILREEEERNRNDATTDEEALRHAIEETFLAEGDATRAVARHNALQDMEARSIETHQLLTLSRWYANVRERSLSAKCSWLQHATERSLLGTYLAKWIQSPPTTKVTRRWRQQTHLAIDATASVERYITHEEEAREHLWLQQCHVFESTISEPHHERMIEVCHALQTSRVAALLRKNEHIVVERRWRTWLTTTLARRPRARALQLQFKNAQCCQLDVFTMLQRAVMPRVLLVRNIWQHAQCTISLENMVALEDILRLHITEVSLRQQLQLTAIGHRAPSLPQVESLRHASEKRVAGRFMVDWLKFGRDRHAKAKILENVVAMEQRAACSLIRRYVDKWYAPVHSAASLTRIEAFIAEEDAQRRHLQGSIESVEFEQLATTRTVSIDEARHTSMTRRVEELACRNHDSLVSRYVHVWSRRAERKVRRAAQLPMIEMLAARNKLTRAFHTWAREVRLSKALVGLVRIKQQTEHRMLRKYYLRLAPRMVRLAKVSRARASLEDAQRAAKILGVHDLAGASARPVAALRLAPLRPADSAPLPSAQDKSL